MQAFTTTSTNGLLRRLNSSVCVKSDFRNDLKLYDNTKIWNAVWDTGATQTCISSKIRESLDLIPVGSGTTSTAGGVINVNRYIIDVLLPSGLIITNLDVIEVDLSNSQCDLLLGMDVITLGDFSVTNYDNKTLYSFRTPSICHVDFVKQYHDEVASSNPDGK